MVSSLLAEHNVREQHLHNLLTCVIEVSLGCFTLVLHGCLVVHSGGLDLTVQTAPVAAQSSIHVHEYLNEILAYLPVQSILGDASVLRAASIFLLFEVASLLLLALDYDLATFGMHQYSEHFLNDGSIFAMNKCAFSRGHSIEVHSEEERFDSLQVKRESKDEIFRNFQDM